MVGFDARTLAHGSGCHFILGLPTAMVGFFLVAPAFVLVLEQVGWTWPWRGLLRVRPALLRQQFERRRLAGGGHVRGADGRPVRR